MSYGDERVEIKQRAVEGIDMVQLVLNLKERWKVIVAIVFVGSVLSILAAMSLTKYYRPSVVYSLPSKGTAAVFTYNGNREFTDEELFKEFYENIRSKRLIGQFIKQNNYLEKLFPDRLTDDNSERLLAELLNDFKVQVLEPAAAKGKIVEFPHRFSMSIMHSNEALAVKLLNEYTQYTNNDVISDIKEDQIKASKIQVVRLNKDVQLMREQALVQRNLTISKMEVENQLKISEFEQQKELLLAVAKENRATEIATKEEENLKQIKVLEQQRALLIEQEDQDRAIEINIREAENAKKLNLLLQQKQLVIAQAVQNRETLIADAKEAQVIAKQLNIDVPTTINSIDNGGKTRSGDTNILLSEAQELPLYLMGTQYLTTLISTLEQRTDDAIFIRELAKINSEIEKVREDEELKLLKLRKSSVPYLKELNELTSKIERLKSDAALEILRNRESDAPFLAELNELNSKIVAVKNDKVLAALKIRQSDDPFIEKLPQKLAEIAQAQSYSYDFDDNTLYSLETEAMVTNKAAKPNRVVIVVMGGLFSAIIAFIWGLWASAMMTRQSAVSSEK